MTTAPAAVAKKEPLALKFLFGGLAGMGGTLFVQPIDLIKNRMQLSGEGGAARQYKSTFHAIASIARQEGFINLYNGLSAGLFRQATYTTARLGLYTILFEKASKDGKPPSSFAVKAALGMTAGGFGAIIGNPAEICLVRMTADGRLPVDQRRNYKHVFDALYRIVKEEGVLTLWRGSTPTVARAMILNAAQLGSYSQAKQMLLKTSFLKDDVYTHFMASIISGLLCTFVSMPVDITKTRIQNMKIIDGKPEYSGVADVLRRTVKAEGFFSLWKGFTPYFLRLGPHTTLTFIFLEKLNKIFLGGGGL